MNSSFAINSDCTPKGDQPTAIRALTEGLDRGDASQVLLGITGSGKTFTMANVIQQTNRPALIIAPNKTLAAQLYSEMKQLFPNNAVEYFVSYYDYYQPEAYIPTTDTFIEKDALINDQIERMRHSTTRALLSRRDVIIVASVSCIYGIGSREWYDGMLIRVSKQDPIERDKLLRRLVELQYDRKDNDFHRSTFRVRGDVVDVFPAYEENLGIRIEYWGDDIERICEIDPIRGTVLRELDGYGIHPSSHFVTPEEERARAIRAIREELQQRLEHLTDHHQLVERQRLEQRTSFDLEMLEQAGFCYGVENYSRHFSGRDPGDPPPTLLDYFPKNFLTVIDESHQTVPQIGAMFRGDRARKTTLVEHGFRLPSALDNRPLKFEEFEERVGQVVYVSATPGDYELNKVQGVVVEQLIRPTGLLDPVIDVRPVREQVDDLLAEIRIRAEKNERVLVTTLTKRMAEDLSDYYRDVGVRVKYLHSDIDTLERVEILQQLRRGEFDVLVGINLLREGLDLPEVSLVAILDADKEGFLRSTRSLIQTIGRAARNSEGRVIMYADTITASMDKAIDETRRRRITQEEYNKQHNITPMTVHKAIVPLTAADGGGDFVELASQAGQEDMDAEALRAHMLQAAEELDFERAARLRDRLNALTSAEEHFKSLKPSKRPGVGKSSRASKSSRAGKQKPPKRAASR